MIVKKFFLYFFSLLILTSCATNNSARNSKTKDKVFFSSSGFALVYDVNLFKTGVIKKRMNNENIEVIHSDLNRSSLLRISNPTNSKFVETRNVKKSEYPNIFNIVLSKKIFTLLGLDPENPYVEVREIKKNKSFIAKKASMYEEEKKVADNSPVGEIKIDILSDDKEPEPKAVINKYSFTILVSDFYYYDSALSLNQKLKDELKIKNSVIKKVTDTKYRLSVGPFKNFNTLKSTYISLNNLGFNELNVLREKR